MEDKYLNDIAEIKKMMSKSSQFISLSGFSGILAGIYCLIGAYFAYRTIYLGSSNIGDYKYLVISEAEVFQLLFIAISVIVISLVTGIFFSVRKANKSNESIWNVASKRLLINFLIPLATGGFFIILLIEREILSLAASLTLTFYGLGCVNASKYTHGDVRYLGLTMIALGLLSTWFVDYGLLFWALGFGVCHILYGSIMYFKYDRKNEKV